MSDRLRTVESLLSDVRPYPPSMREVTPRIAGRAFFPGGRGSYQGEHVAALPDRPLMLFGQDFDTLDGYMASIKAGAEGESGTWEGIRSILGGHAIVPESCFYTNVIMGARRSGPNTGPSPALSDTAFIERCIAFALRQIEIIRPRVVVALGTMPAALLGTRLLQRPMPTPRAATWRHVDGAIPGFVDAVPGWCEDLPAFGFATSVLPCLWRSNVRYRAWGELRGAQAHHAIWACVARAMNDGDAV